MDALIPQKLNQQVFHAYGHVIETAGHQSVSINSGNCQRYSDLAKIDIDASGQTGISLFDAKAYKSPIKLSYVERHPLGTQAFLPTSLDPYLVIVADDVDGVPQTPKVFITDGYQGVSYHRNTWHGVLTPIVQQSLFVVVDYIGEGNNLEECAYDDAYHIHLQ